jgi:CRISPR/Cas system CSM-associated protein Csm5 (group 7 of RAMP superfamily)
MNNENMCKCVSTSYYNENLSGYDMEDAMIISKSSFERGFGHGSMYKTIIIDLNEEEKKFISHQSKKNIMENILVILIFILMVIM